jgi:hypothetical protein
MRRAFPILLLLFLAISLPAAAEEISLKDGTKIVGHMTAITADKIEVETAYGKMQLKRSDILSINFPENGSPASATASPVPAKTEVPKFDEVLRGTQYMNRTAKFSLTVPPDWKINRNAIHLATTLTGLSSQDNMRFLIVSQEEYNGSLESYEEIIEINLRKSLGSYENLSKSPITIDGKPGMLVTYRGLSKDNNVPIQFLSALIPTGTSITRVTAWCIEPLFHETEPAFEKILTSYRSAGQMTVAGPSTKP